MTHADEKFHLWKTFCWEIHHDGEGKAKNCYSQDSVASKAEEL